MYFHANDIKKRSCARIARAWKFCINRTVLIRLGALMLMLSMQVPSLAASVVSLAGLASDHELTVIQDQGRVQVILSHVDRPSDDSTTHHHNWIETLYISKRTDSGAHPDHCLSFAQFDSLSPKAETGGAEPDIKATVIAGLFFYALASVDSATQMEWIATRYDFYRPLQPCRNLQGIVMRR
ncbi:MAG: hypothetical protein ACSHX4_04840 [Opitutaceae bacterium]